MLRQNVAQASLAAAIALIALVSTCKAQDYDGEAETAITGLGGLSGLSGLSGLAGLANGVVTGYAPMGAGSEMANNGDGMYHNGPSERGLGAAESSEAESGDYDDDSNDSSASEEHPILSKFINLISGGRHKRSIESVADQSQVHNRVKRGYKGWVPYVSTYVKTDKKANFKWGVSHIQQLL